MKKVILTISFIVMYFLVFNGNCVLGSTEKEIEEGIYELYTAVNGTKVVDIERASQEDGTNVSIYERGNQNNQKFQVKLNEDGSYTFIALHSNKVLDVYRGRRNERNQCMPKSISWRRGTKMVFKILWRWLL